MNEYIEEFGYGQSTEIAEIEWYKDGVQVHHTLCYDEEEVMQTYFFHLMPGSPTYGWEPRIIFKGEPVRYEGAAVCKKVS